MIRRIFMFLILLGTIGGLVWYYAFRPVGELVITGIVTTDNVIVSSQVAGRLKTLSVDQGQIVTKGEKLAVIQADQWQADLDFYKQSEEQAGRQVMQSEADVHFQQKQTESQIAQAEANLATAEAQVAQAQADLENSRLTYQHEEEAYKRGAESLQVYDQARTSFDAQKARLEATKKQRDSAKAAVDVAKASTEQVNAHLAALEMSKHQLLATSAQRQKAEVMLGYTEIVAPVDAIVDQRAAREGEVVNIGQPIVTLINPDNLWVRADVEESYVDRIKMGDKLTVRLPSGATREGTVFYRSVDADYATQRDVSRTKRDIKTFEVRIRCDNKDRALAVGMTAYIPLTFTAH